MNKIVFIIIVVVFCVSGVLLADKPASKPTKTPQERIKELEKENAFLKEVIIDLNKRLQTKESTQKEDKKLDSGAFKTKEDRMDDSIKDMISSGTIANLSFNGPRLTFEMDQNKWIKLPKEKQKRFILGMVEWAKTKVHPNIHSEISIEMLSQQLPIPLAEYSKGGELWIRD